MPCIFGFGFHEEFCPCDLVNEGSDLDQLVCDQCNVLLRLEYDRFTGSPDQKETGMVIFKTSLEYSLKIA
jgi:hypothetical protein